MQNYMVILLVAALAGVAFWDYRKMKNRVVPPPPKPAPLPVAAEVVDATEYDPSDFADALIALHKSVPDDNMTPSEWAQIQEMIALGNLNVADRISAGIGISIIIFGSAAVPGAFWAPLGVGLLFWWLVPRPFTKAYEQARDRALRT